MVCYCKEEGIIFHCIFGARKQPYTAGRKFQAGIDSNENRKVQEQKTQESCRAAAPGDLSRRGQIDMPDVTQFSAILLWGNIDHFLNCSPPLLTSLVCNHSEKMNIENAFEIFFPSSHNISHEVAFNFNLSVGQNLRFHLNWTDSHPPSTGWSQDGLWYKTNATAKLVLQHTDSRSANVMRVYA